MSLATRVAQEINTVRTEIGVKSTAPMNISSMLKSTASLTNTIQSIGFNSYLYTGDGLARDIVTGVDMKSNWEDYAINSNSSFSSDTDWIKQSSWTISGGVAIADGVADSKLYQSIGVSGKAYIIDFDVISRVSGTIGALAGSNVTFNISTVGSHRTMLTSNGTSLGVQSNNFNGSIDNLKIYETWVAGTYNTGDELVIEDTSGRLLRCVCLQDGVTSDPNGLLIFTDATFSDWKIESKTFGGRVWIKERTTPTTVNSHQIFDTIRGRYNTIFSDATNAESELTDNLTSFNVDGFSIDVGTRVNENTSTYVSWSDQTTFVESFLTSHNRPAIRETNVITGYVQIKYKGSELAGHEIEHGMGRELGFVLIKNLNTAYDWISFYQDNNVLSLNTNGAEIPTTNLSKDEVKVSLFNFPSANEADSLHMLYGYTNSFIDENDTLQGNYEIGTYQGTSNVWTLKTKTAPLYFLVKKTSGTGEWHVFDIVRDASDGELYLSLATIGSTNRDVRFSFSNEGIVFTANTTLNNSGDTYLYKVVYDNDNGSGASKYDQPTDTTQLQEDAIFSVSNGYNSVSGVNNQINTFSGTVIPVGGWQE